jgi:hypothetical protein
MNPKLLSTTITLLLSLLVIALFVINDEWHLIGHRESYDFLAGPILVPLYGLSSIYNFTAQAIIFLLLFWLLMYQSLAKTGWQRYAFALAAISLWLVSGIYTLAVAYS